MVFMIAAKGPSIWRLIAKAAAIGLCVSALLNLIVLFLPLPDTVVQVLVALQALGLVFEIWRATPYHMSAWNPFLVNAAVYAAMALAVMVMRRRRKADITLRAV
jgi:hypothetical protein